MSESPSGDRKSEIIKKLEVYKQSEALRLVVELINLRRDKYRDKLESAENSEARGRAKECKDLSRIFS